MNRRHLFLVLTLFISTSVGQPLRAQDNPAPILAPNATPAEVTDRAWTLLTTTVADTKHVDNTIQALAALGTMGTNTRAAQLIVTALKDPERDIRTAAILAAGQTKNPTLLPALNKALDDDEPEVAFAAATTLWKMKDYSGEDILVTVANGERRGNATLVNGARHTMARDIHNPVTLARIGAMQGASILLGPFGFGLAAIDYARKNGGESARSSAIDLLAQQRTPDTHSILIDALEDKDPGVRAAAAKGLGQWTDAATAKSLEFLIDDPKLPVRLTAAAAYLRSTGPHHNTRQKKS